MAATFHGIDVNHLLKIKGNRGYGVSLAVARGNDAGHTGWNEGFLTFWKLSLEEDLCVTGMVNRVYGCAYEGLREIGTTLFDRSK